MVAEVDLALRQAELKHFSSLEELKDRLSKPPKSKMIRREGFKALGIVAKAVREHLRSHPRVILNNLHRDVERYNQKYGHFPQLRINEGEPTFTAVAQCGTYARANVWLMNMLFGADVEHGIITIPGHVAKTVKWGKETLVVDPVMPRAIPVDNYLSEILRAVHSDQSPAAVLAVGGGLRGHTNPKAYLEENTGLNDNEAIIASEFYNYGNQLIRANQPRKAIHWIRRALRFRDNHVFTWNNLAVAYDEIGKLRLAEKYYKKAMDASPNHVNSRVGLGLLHIRRKNIPAAREALASVTALKPDDALVKYFKAKIHQAKGEQQQALHLLRQVAMARFDSDWARHELGKQYLAMGRHEAIPELRKAAALNAYNASARHDLAKALVNAGRHKEAIPHLEKAIRLNPKAKRPRQLLRKIKLKLQRQGTQT